METARPALEALRVDWERVPVITRDQVKFAKPDPDLFLAAAARLGSDIHTSSVVVTASGTCWRPAALRL